MTKRLVLRWSIALLLVVGSSASYGATTQALARLRALSCCAHDCGHTPARTADPSRCCGVAPAGGTAASIAPAAPSAAPVLVAVLLTAPASSAATSSRTAESPELAAARAAPVFLLTRSLRI